MKQINVMWRRGKRKTATGNADPNNHELILVGTNYVLAEVFTTGGQVLSVTQLTAYIRIFSTFSMKQCTYKEGLGSLVDAKEWVENELGVS